MRKDWAYEELREKMVAELPPRVRGVEEDPRIARLRVVLRRGSGLGAEAWEVELADLEDLLEEELLSKRAKHFLEELT